MLHKLLKRHPTFVYAQEIAQICQPLKKLEIGYFSHVKITNDKKISAISSNPSFAEHYLKNKYYQADIHKIDSNKFGHYFLWDGAEFSNQSAEICKVASEFGVYKPLTIIHITIIHKNNKSIDYYHFGGMKAGSQNNSIYLANLDLLNLFTEHFNAQIQQSKTLSKAHQMTFDNVSYKTGSLSSFKDQYALNHRDEFIQSLRPKTKIRCFEVGDVRLSKQQSEILKYIVQGKTYKEIARQMELSNRTIGHYFEAVKNKLNASNRADVIQKIIEHKLIKLF